MKNLIRMILLELNRYQVITQTLNQKAESDNPDIQKEAENSKSEIEEINGENIDDKPKENN